MVNTLFIFDIDNKKENTRQLSAKRIVKICQNVKKLFSVLKTF